MFIEEVGYKKKLVNPRWQRKRLEVFQEDDFTCQICGDKDNTIVVHHIRYINGLEPWEYDNSLLITLCKDCHDFVHERGRWAWIKEYEKLKCNNICLDV